MRIGICILLLIGGCEGTVGDSSVSPPPPPPPSDGGSGTDAGSRADGSRPPDPVDGGTAVDARTPVPEGLVPMFVASGFGGRTATSCDDGMTWMERRLADDDDDHSEFTEKGLAYGDGIFVQLMGWGASSSFQVSSNGVDWTRVMTDERFGGLAYSNGRFVASGQRTSFTSTDGLTWTAAGEAMAPDHVREGGGGGPFGVLTNTAGPIISMDGAQTWQQIGACAGVASFGGVGQYGGVQYAAGRLVMFDQEGRWCTSTDGSSWSTGTSDATRNGWPNSGKMMFAGGLFRYMNGASALTSPDGETWTRVDFMPAGLELHAIAQSDAGTFVAFDRHEGEFYRSSDGVSWTSVGVYGGGSTRLTRVVFGYADASSACPM